MSQNESSLSKLMIKVYPSNVTTLSVSHGSILVPVLCNLHIIDLVENIICDSLKYANNFTLYKHSKLKNF